MARFSDIFRIHTGRSSRSRTEQARLRQVVAVLAEKADRVLIGLAEDAAG